ncbi:Poly(ADPribose) polymerase catalytic domain containing protein [Acanthamoeba castellanii str. Neff]|uniref:Poly(ADPribose) polymerase catalytic domain containing protein n=1 Tax=Acanthamoeba castellanii (strain ATCC 30010 / Neff) TaxID=1257118 RepID=L8H6I0_ACACF|nr:Poly(ADPribose) polymerase catalytic domain containing protein [Acanthamoeba castellanii str. Neff]ELR20061.1 Poly(ADPribose) polymerase catalytic domain containing protein [Acanthamoeba castellanii str. Neff]
MKEEEEQEVVATTYAGLEWKVKQLVTAAINAQTMKPALTKHFAEEKLEAASLEDVKAALDALQSIEERDLEEDEVELSNASKIHILKQVVAYLEHAPYSELPFSCGEVVKEVMANFYSIRAATTNLLNYRKLQSIHDEINDENVAEHCYENLFNYHIEPLAKNSHEFRTILKYLGETNTMPKTSLQVKEVFVLKEKAAYAEHVHGAGFESTYNDEKRILLWHGVPRHQVFHALTAEIPRTAQGSFMFSSQFAYAVCQEQETCNSIYREPAAQENACLLLAEVAVGEPERTLGSGRSFPLLTLRNDPCRLARDWTMERLSDKVVRNDHAIHNETNARSHEVTKLQDGVVVPQGPVRCLPLDRKKWREFRRGLHWYLPAASPLLALLLGRANAARVTAAVHGVLRTS